MKNFKIDINPTKVALGLFGVSYYCYQHINWIKYHLNLHELPEAPFCDDVHVPFSVETKPQFEQEFDQDIAEIENKLSSSGESQEISPGIFYKGEITKDNDERALPHGEGQLYNTKDCSYTGRFFKGVMDGNIKVTVRINNHEKIEKSQYTNGVKQYSISCFPNGVRCEGSPNTFRCVRPGGSFYLENTKSEENKVESFLFNEKGYLQGKKVLNKPDMNGTGMHYYEDGRLYIGELDEIGPNGKGIIKDQYGDIVFDGNIQNGKTNLLNLKFVESMLALGCVLGTFV